MDKEAKLFEGEHKYCKWCNRQLAAESESELCPACQASMLFRQAREYVREHDVNEYQLAQALEIPLRQVKEWIREGRLEYRELEKKITTIHCQNCGKEIKFGNYCPECTHASHGVTGGFETYKPVDAQEQMRFYGEAKRK